MNTSLRTRALATGCALVLTLAACGGDDDDAGADDAADSPVAQALAAELLAEEDSPIATEEDAQCVSGEIVSGIGEDRLLELGVTADSVGDMEDIDFTDGELETIVDSMFGCVDMTAAMAAEWEADFGEEGAQCLAESLDQDLIADLMKQGLAGDDAEMPDEFFQAFLDIAAECDLPLN